MLDFVASAQNLRSLLVLHNWVAVQVRLLDNHSEAITRRIFKHDLRRHNPDMSTNFLRLSVANGVREMLEQLRKSTVKKVQKLCREVLIQMHDESDMGQGQVTLDDEDVLTMPRDSAASEFTYITGLTLRGE